MDFITIAADIGSTQKGNFAFARVDAASEPSIARTGSDIGSCVDSLAEALQQRVPVSLGIEAPCWLPVPATAEHLCKGRDGEGSRSCFAPAGGYVATLGMHQLSWILRSLYERRASPVEITTRREEWTPERLLLWEAFVSGDAHASKSDVDPHVRDAVTSAMGFVRAFREEQPSAVALRDDEQAFSLVGGVLGWARVAGYVLAPDEDIVGQPFVVRPPKYDGAIGV